MSIPEFYDNWRKKISREEIESWNISYEKFEMFMSVVSERFHNSDYFDRKSENSYSIPTLEQNNPNPFNQQTQIAYFIPDNCNNTSLHIYDLNGVELKVIDINQKGKGNVTIDANSLKAGMYLYTLICDGREIATKKMILTSK